MARVGRLGSALLAGSAMLLVLAPPVQAQDVAPGTICAYDICTGPGSAQGEAFEVEAAQPGSPAEGSTGATQAGTASEYTFTRTEYVIACSGNGPGMSENICNNAISCPDPTETNYWVYRQTVTVVAGEVTTTSPWTQDGAEVCRPRAADDAPTIDQVVAAVRSEFVRKRPAVPSVTVRPAPRVLITVRNSFSAGSAEPVELTDTVLGRPIVITATPERWVWDFGDGTTRTTMTPGAAGTLEVAHAYEDAGDVSVQVTVEWLGTFTVGGFAGSFPIDGVARVASEPVVLQVREARTELVDR